MYHLVREIRPSRSNELFLRVKMQVLISEIGWYIMQFVLSPPGHNEESQEKEAVGG